MPSQNVISFSGPTGVSSGRTLPTLRIPNITEYTLHVLLTLGGVVLIVFIPIQYHTRLAPYDSTYLLHLAVYPSFVPILLAHSLKCFFRAFLAQLVLSSSQ